MSFFLIISYSESVISFLFNNCLSMDSCILYRNSFLFSIVNTSYTIIYNFYLLMRNKITQILALIKRQKIHTSGICPHRYHTVSRSIGPNFFGSIIITNTAPRNCYRNLLINVIALNLN